jgi:retinol dehydrogenase 12
MELGDFSTIKSFADRAEKELDRIDYLVENAAVTNGGKYLLTSDGWEQE